MTSSRSATACLILGVTLAAVLALAGCTRETAQEGRAAPGSPGAIEMPSGPRLYVTNEGGGDIAVVDLATARVTARIPVGRRPRGIRSSPDGRFVYVALSGSPIGGPGVDESTLPPADKRHDGIGVVDAETGAVVRVLPGGSDPEQFAISHDGSRLFVSNEDAAAISVVDVESGEVVRSLAVGEEPEGVDLTPDGRFAYATSEGAGTVTVVDTTSLAVVKTIEVGPRPRSTAFLPDGSRAFVTTENAQAVQVVDSRRHVRLSDIVLSSASFKPMGVAVSPDGSRIVVTTGRGGALVVLEARTHDELAVVPVGARPWGVALSPDGRTAYTANGPSNDVSVVDLTTGTVKARIAVGERPWGVVLADPPARSR
jgi:YVTN family beta-propeller protein